MLCGGLTFIAATGVFVTYVPGLCLSIWLVIVPLLRLGAKNDMPTAEPECK